MLATHAPPPAHPPRLIFRVPLLRAGRLSLFLALACLALVPAPAWRPAAAESQADQATLHGVLVTLSATAEAADEQAAGTPPALVLRVTVENQAGADLRDLHIQSPVPARARILESTVAGAATADLTERSPSAISWSVFTLAAGAAAGPFAYRIVPDAGADGAVIFREAVVRPQVSWTGPRVRVVPAPPAIRLNGLWGEPALRRTVLPTGLTVFTRERPGSPSVALRMAVRAGSRDEDDVTTGGSHWIEHAYFLGTTTRPDNQAVFKAITNVGGDINASTGWESTDFFNVVPADQFDVGLDVLSDQLLNSTFSPAAFNRERQVVFQEHKLRNDNPGVHVFDEFLRLVFQVSPLRRGPAGTPEAFLTVPIPVILQYRADHYVTGNMAIMASGDLKHDEAVAKIARAFAPLPIGPRLVRPHVLEPIQTEPRRSLIGEGTRLAEMRLGWPAPGYNDPDFPAMYILQDILGATGQRLSEAIRGRALATAVSPDYIIFSDASAFSMSATTQPERADAVVAAMLTQIQRLRDGDVTDAEVQTSLRAIAGRRARAQETNVNDTNFADDEVSDQIESYEEYFARLGRVTAADVQRVARRYLDTSNYTLVILRP